MGDALDRPVWAALGARQRHVAQGDARAWRLAPDYGVFAAPCDWSPQSLSALAALATPGSPIWLVESEPVPPVPGLHASSAAPCGQMVLEDLAPLPARIAAVPLTEADAPAMLALATLTRPGPFFARTHQLGAFIGVKQDGVLVAMAGERLQPPGHTEVSGVCTHPDHRGRGYAGALLHRVAQRILARGERPILHVYASNAGAIALYEKLGFRTRRTVTMTVLEAAR